MGQLIAWRRSEMMHAEKIARMLGADFTLLGTKHSMETLRYLVAQPNVTKTYLSHRISELRRLNMAGFDPRTGRSEGWSRVASEVNLLHKYFADESQVLINPTAIDELRFHRVKTLMGLGNEASVDGPARQQVDGPSARLADRWMLPRGQELIWSNPSEQDGELAESDEPEQRASAEAYARLVGSPDYSKAPQHSELLSFGLEVDDPIALGVARSLFNQIYFDIAARDHMIIEHTPGLCVYRPFFRSHGAEVRKQADWSGGVRQEIEHWTKKIKEPDPNESSAGAGVGRRNEGSIASGSHRVKAAFVHTVPEIAARLQWLTSPSAEEEQFPQSMKRHLREALKEKGCPRQDSDLLWKPDGLKERFAHLVAAGRGDFVMQNPDIVFDLLKSSIAFTLHALFTGLESQHDYESGLFFAWEQPDQQVENLVEVAKDLCAYFAGTSAPDEARKRFWKEVYRQCQVVLSENPAADISRAFGFQYDDLVEQASFLGKRWRIPGYFDPDAPTPS